MFKKAVLVSLVIFSAQLIQASQQAATPMQSGSAMVCPEKPERVRSLPRRHTNPYFGALVAVRFEMGMWAADNSQTVASVLSPAKKRARLVVKAINASNETLAYPKNG